MLACTGSFSETARWTGVTLWLNVWLSCRMLGFNSRSSKVFFFFVYSNMSPVNNAVVAGTLFFFLCDTDNFKLLHLNLQSAGAYLLAMDRGTRVCAT